LVASPALAAKSIKLHHLNQDDPFDNPTGAMATVFKSLVEAGSNGGITVQTFPNGQLGKDNEVLEQVKSGVVETGIFSVGGFRRRLPAHRRAGCPLRVPQYQRHLPGVRRSLRPAAGRGYQEEDRHDGAGLRRLGRVLPHHQQQEAHHLSGRLGRPEDPHHGPGHAQGDHLLPGGQPTALAWAEVYTGLQTGVADGR